MKAVFRHYATPDTPRDDGVLVEDIHIFVDLPFLPHAGMMMKLTPDGEYLKVQDVYWSVEDPRMLDIAMDELEEPLLPLSQALAQGWIRGDYGTTTEPAA